LGPYRIVERLGSGGMGSVYRAVDDQLGRDVALKILATTTADAAARLRAEAEALGRLSHPGVAAVYDLIEDDEHLALVMEFIPGQTLQDVLEQGGMFSPRRAAELCAEILAALEHVHAAGVVHRDLKPANVMLSESGAIKLTDFGIARVDGAVGLTAAGKMLGTPAYMAPEQVLGHAVDARVDLYATGVVFFRLVTGALPFKGSTPFEMAQAQVNDAPARASDQNRDLPAWVDAILKRALEKRPGDRFQSAAEFRQALAHAALETVQSTDHVVERTEAMVRPVLAAPPRTNPAARRSPRPWLVAGVALTSAAAVWMSFLLGSAIANQPAADQAVQMSQQPAPAPATQAIATGTTASPGATDAAASAAAPMKPAPAVSSGDSVRTGGASGPAGARLPSVWFDNIKVLTVTGDRTTTADVIVHFSAADVQLQSETGKSAGTAMPYQRIAKATYTHGRDPQWDPGFSRPAGKIDVGGGIFGRDRHWLVLQGPDTYIVLRLDGGDRNSVMKAFEDRARVSIDRSQAVRKPD
jgi:serine/threonine-protein kinase